MKTVVTCLTYDEIDVLLKACDKLLNDTESELDKLSVSDKEGYMHKVIEPIVNIKARLSYKLGYLNTSTQSN